MSPTATARPERKVRRSSAPTTPRRVSGPITGRARHAPQPAPRPAHRRSLAERTLAVVRSLPDHSLLDKVVRGRAWIPILGVMLAGIVAMQVEVLKLGAGIGRSITRTTTLTSRNEQLQASVAALSDGQRIEQLAARMGMVMPPPDAVGFLSARAGENARRALANVHAPNASAFLSLLSANGAVVQQAPSAPVAPTTATATVAQAPQTAGGSTTTATTTAAPTTTTPIATQGPGPTPAPAAATPSSANGAAGLAATTQTGNTTGG